VLLGGSIGYFIYGFKARSGLGGLNYTPTPLMVRGATPEPGDLASVRGTNPYLPGGNSTDSFPDWAIWEQSAYPGEALRARYWADPLAYEPRLSYEAALVEGFKPVDARDVPAKHSLARATRIIIPSLEIDSSVVELAVTDLGDSRAYETPKRTVGHIPETANAGEKGTAWFFGHLESPIRGEGSVFKELPRIPEMLRHGEMVYAIFESAKGAYLYRLTSSEVMGERDLKLYDVKEATLRLVTCVPALYYDHRLVIWGELVGVRK
jgi:LPXTG-site transpeptidase (sortase) family protein